jgi:hypothetical protein
VLHLNWMRSVGGFTPVSGLACRQPGRRVWAKKPSCDPFLAGADAVAFYKLPYGKCRNPNVNGQQACRRRAHSSGAGFFGPPVKFDATFQPEPFPGAQSFHKNEDHYVLS